MELREYQIRDVARVRDAFRRTRRVAYQLATGGGKTVLFSHIIHSAAARGKRTYVIVHREELVGQTSDKLTAYGVPHGIVMPGITPSHELVQVCMVQTLVRRMDRLVAPDFIVVDEGHHAAAGTWARILERWCSAYVLLVTATPERLDGKGLGAFADEMICGPSSLELVEMGFLCRPRVFASPNSIDMSGVKTTRGDFDQTEMTEVVKRSLIVGDAVEHYKRLCAGKPALAFCVSIEESEKTAAQFRAAGFNAVSLDGKTEKWYRQSTLKGLATGSVNVVTSCNLISEGFDCPGVVASILLRPTQSLTLYLQQVGRALRPFAGKDHALILDHVGNVFRHGMPDADRAWSLDGRKARQKAETQEPSGPVRQCPTCYCCHAPAPKCPVCGHTYQNRQPPKSVDGELTELTPEQQDALLLRKQKRREEGRARTLESLVHLATSRGYKNPLKWAQIRHDYRLKKQAENDERV